MITLQTIFNSGWRVCRHVFRHAQKQVSILNFLTMLGPTKQTWKKFKSFRGHVLSTIKISTKTYLFISTQQSEVLWKSSFIGYKCVKYSMLNQIFPQYAWFLLKIKVNILPQSKKFRNFQKFPRSVSARPRLFPCLALGWVGG